MKVDERLNIWLLGYCHIDLLCVIVYFLVESVKVYC